MKSRFRPDYKPALGRRGSCGPSAGQVGDSEGGTSSGWLDALHRAPLYERIEEVDRTIVDLIDQRRAMLAGQFRAIHREPEIDSYHGEVGFPLHPQAAIAVVDTMRELAECKHALAEPDGRLFSKGQPKILQELCAERIFDRFLTAPVEHGAPGRRVCPEEVLVIPYSALAMFEAVIGALAEETPGGVVLCPAGFYKEYHQHIQKFGLRLVHFDTDLWRNCKIDPVVMRAAIRGVRASGGDVAALGLTIPGNPLIAEYDIDELRALGRVLIEEDVRAVVDASFDKIVPSYIPLAAIDVEIGERRHSLYDRVMTISGLSKSHMAFGPLKIGIACCGSKHWRDRVRAQATLTFQRETTALAATVLMATPMSYVLSSSADMVEKLSAAKEFIRAANASRSRPILEVVGKADHGPFLVLSLTQPLLERAGIRRGHELSELIINECGVNNVSSDRIGIAYPCVRLNVHCARTGPQKDPALTPILLSRIVRMADRVASGELTYASSMAALPSSLGRRLDSRRIAYFGRAGREWAEGAAWPIDLEYWTIRRDLASETCTYVPGREALAQVVHAAVMSAADASTHLTPWLRACRTNAILLLEDPSTLWQRPLDVLARVKTHGIQCVSWRDARLALTSRGEWRDDGALGVSI